jgi:hypothetical protein
VLLASFMGWITFLSATQPPVPAQMIPDPPGKDLSVVLLFGWRMPDVGFRGLPAAAVKEYLVRQSAFRSALPSPTTDEEAMFSSHRRGIERVSWCLLSGPDVSRVVQEFMREGIFYYEWEGMSEAPLGEARALEAYLQRHRSSALADYVHLLIGHRYSCAAELQGEGKSAALSKDRSFTELKLAARSPNPLIRLVAQQIIGRPGCQLQIL